MAKTPEQPQIPVKKKAIFVGKNALVRLINSADPSQATIWLIDNSNKTIRPFVSEDKFDQMFKDPAQAHKSVTTLSADELAPNGLLGDFHVLGHEYGVQKNGSMKNVDYSPSQLQGRYGKPIDQNAENNAVTSLDNLFGGMSGQSPQGQPQPPATPPQPPTTGTGGPGSHTVYDNTEPGMIYDGQGGPGVASIGNIGPNSTDTASIKALQQWLGIPVTGTYDSNTFDKVKAWQTQAGFDTKGNPGYFGPLSKAYLASQPDNYTPNGQGNTSQGNTGTNNAQAGDTPQNPTGTSPALTTTTYGLADNPMLDASKKAAIITGANSGSSIPATFLQSIMNNPSQMGAFIGAMAYGGYSIADIYTEMSRQWQLSPTNPNGNKNVPANPLISYTQPRSQNPQIDQQEQGIVPTTDKFFGNDPTMAQFNSIQTPDFTPGQSFLTAGTAEYSAAIDQIRNNLFDAKSLQASASTDAENVYATTAYNQAQTDAESKLGIQLSDDANTAWGQLDSIDSMYGRKAYGRRGIQGSGIEEQESQDILNQARRQDQNKSVTALNAYDAAQATFLHTSGSPAQIAALTDAQRKAYGFVPSDPSLYSVASIMAANPGMTTQDATDYSNSIIDPATGNYRSQIYNKYYQDKLNNGYSNAENAIAASNDLFAKNNALGITKGSVTNNSDVNVPDSSGLGTTGSPNPVATGRTTPTSTQGQTGYGPDYNYPNTVPEKNAGYDTGSNSNSGNQNTGTPTNNPTPPSGTGSNTQGTAQFDPNNGNRLTPGQSVTFQGNTYTQGGAMGGTPIKQ